MMEAEFGRLDQWRDSGRVDLEEGRRLADRIEQRARSEDEIAARAAYLDLLGLAPGQRVLEVGCGTGAVLRDLARRVRPGGQVVGLDQSPALLTVAQELLDAHGLGGTVELRQGDARALPFGDAEFDAVLAVTVLSHVPDGERAIPEMVRVVRPGGRVGIFDRDTDAAIVSHPDRALTRRIVAAYSDQSSVDGWLARRAPGLLAAAGLTGVRARAFTPLEQDPAAFYGGMADRMLEVARAAGAVSDAEARQWLDALRAEQAAGRFLVGIVQILAWGTRPG